MNKKKKKSETSSDNYFYLPPELIREVLARLPAKTLIKFRSVSKTWLCLIDSFDFISLHSKFHNNNAMNNPQLLAWERRLQTGSILTLRTTDSFKTIRNLGRIRKNHIACGSSNGLMLIKSFGNCDKLLLWNPSIGKALMLPDSPFNLVDAYHLGFVPSSNDYKVLALDCWKGAGIYSLTDDCWRLISDRFDFKACASSLVSGVVCCGEAIYSMDRKAENLYSFDFEAEQFSFVQLPDSVKKCSVKESMLQSVFRIGDSPAIFTMSSKKCLIWVMNKDKDGGENPNPWRVWHSGKPNSYICNSWKKLILNIVYHQKSNTFIISYISNENSESSSKMRYREKLMTYNITSQEIKHVGKSLRGRVSFCTHVESLVFHKGFEGRRLISFPSDEEMPENS